MFEKTRAFSGFSVNNLKLAREFYATTLGLKVEMEDDTMNITIAGGIPIFVYQKDDHTPATYTILNFPVDDIKEAHSKLISRGVVFEHYEGMTDENGIAWGATHNMGPNIAWFKDPAGNILSILSDK